MNDVSEALVAEWLGKSTEAGKFIEGARPSWRQGVLAKTAQSAPLRQTIEALTLDPRKGAARSRPRVVKPVVLARCGGLPVIIGWSATNASFAWYTRRIGHPPTHLLGHMRSTQ
jgi:hypothetical protein